MTSYAVFAFLRQVSRLLGDRDHFDHGYKKRAPLSARFYLLLHLRSQAPADHVHQVTAVA